MKAVFLRSATLLLAASLGACSTMGGGGSETGAEVTRFHLNQPIARGQIAVEPADPADANSVEFRAYAGAVERQLTRFGWTVVNRLGSSEQVAIIDVEQGSREALRQRPPATMGGSMGRREAGASAGPGAVGSSEIVATLLEVRIKRRSDGTIFWEGRATSEARAGAPEAQREAAVQKLADALFRDFPGESGRTIRVR